MSEQAAERSHHPFSPSKLQYLEANPNYVGEERDTPLDASLRGTAQHNAAEGDVDLDDPTLEDHEAEAVADCKNYREQIIAKYPGGTVLKEVYLPIDNKQFTFNGVIWLGTTAGYIDLAVVSATQTEAEIADWKFGLWSVEKAENNLQGIAYLLGLFKLYPKLEKVTVHFVMPHREEVEVHTFTRDEFEGLYLRVCTVVARALAAQTSGNFDACKPMAPSCLFCGNKATCTSLAGFVLKVGKKFAPLQIPTDINPTTFNKVEEASMTMTVAQLMESWGKAMRRQITERTIEDEKWNPENYVLRQRANREIVNSDRVVEMAKARGVSDKVLEGCWDITLTPVFKAIRDTKGRGEKEAAESDFREALISDGCLTEKPPTIFLERLKS